jgi:hypothetical protein
MPARDPHDSPDRRIDFVIAGAQKAGTTTLDAALRLHPEISMPRGGKELFFFDRDEYFPPDRGPDYANYHRHWDWSRTGVRRGEATPSYLAIPSALERMARYSPDLRVICILRNPVSRAYSAWNHQVQLGRERLSFHRALLAEEDRLAEAARRGVELRARSGYQLLSRYGTQLELLWKLIPRERTLVVQLETLNRHPQETMDRLTDFLGVSRLEAGSIQRKHARLKLGDLHPETARWLVERFEPEIAKVEELLGWDCSEWRRPKGSTRTWAIGETLRRAALPFSFVKPRLERLRVRVGAWRRARREATAADA